MSKILTLLILFSYINFAHAQESQNIEGIQNWNIFKGTGYSITYPNDWVLDQSGRMETSFILLSPLTSDTDEFSENVNLIIQDLSNQKVDLNKIVKKSEKDIKNFIAKSKIIKSSRVKNNTEEYHTMIYTGNFGKFPLKFTQFYWIKNGKSYILTFTSEQSKYSDYKKIGEDILHSFSFEN